MTPEKTQATKKPSATCDKCDKTLSSKQSMVRHMKTVHDGIISLKDLFSSHKNLANPKRLFNSVPDLSAQGNSHGQVNDPKVYSEGSFICGACDQSFLTNDEVTNHKSEAHDNANFQCGECSKCFISIEEVQKHNDKDHNGSQPELNEEDEVLEEAAEEQDLYEKLDELIQEAFDNGDSSEGRDELRVNIA